MYRGRIRFGAAMTVLLCWATQGPVQAAGLEVKPTGVFLTPGEFRGTVDLTNKAESPVTVQAQVFEWRQDETGERLEKTNEILAAPPVFTLQPGGKQIVRVGFRRVPAAKQELTYRLLLSEVPDRTGQAGEVGVAIRLSLPVFYTPPGAAGEVGWSISLAEAGKLRVRLHNAGTAHLKIGELSIVRTGAAESPLGPGGGYKYVLPGVTREWVMPVEGVTAGESLLLKAKKGSEELEHEFAMPGG